MSSRSTSSGQDVLNVLHDLSQLLNTGLDRDTLFTCVKMIEGGANPEALAAVIKELRKENAGKGKADLQINRNSLRSELPSAASNL